ncbi:MAG UNVERIFIED_CONTAM: hypothetical protein LVR18_20600 [Planctomycetaceae bacterium]
MTQTTFCGHPWFRDSLSVLAIVSFVDEACDFPLQVSELQGLQTAGQLLNLLNSRGPVHQASREA